MFCGSVLLVTGGGILAESSCAPTVLCDVLRVRVLILDWDCVCVSFHRVWRICDKLDSLIYHTKVLLDCDGGIRGGAENGTGKGGGAEESGTD